MLKLVYIIPIFIGLLCYVYSLGRIVFAALRGSDIVESAIIVFYIGGLLNVIGLLMMAVCALFERG